MKEQIEQIKQVAKEQITKAVDLQTLNEVRVKYLGKKGELTAVLRGMGALSPVERPVIGELVNKVRDELEVLISQKEKALEEKKLLQTLEKEKIDITLPSSKMRRGSKHPVNRIIEELEDLFVSMGNNLV